MTDAITATLPDQWRLLFELLLIPLSWIPAVQDTLLNWAWDSNGFWMAGLRRAFLLLPALLVVVVFWSTMLAFYTVPFRSGRGDFLISLVGVWWEAGRSIWLFWVGIVRFFWVMIGWAWGLLRLSVELFFKALRRAFVTPFAMMDWMGRKYFKPGVPWLAFVMTIAWSALEALIFTFALLPTVTEIFYDISGFEGGVFLPPILFIFLFGLIAGSFAALQGLAEAVASRNPKQIVGMLVVEFTVMFFEVFFLYRELVDAITPWLAAQTGGQLVLGLWTVIGLAAFGWVGIRAMTWFLFGRYGTPALLAVLSRETLSVQMGPGEAVPAMPEADWWRGPIDALKRESEWFKSRARELLELLSLPVLQLLAAAVNCATVVIAGRPAFRLPFTELDQVMARDTLLQALLTSRSGRVRPRAEPARAD